MMPSFPAGVDRTATSRAVSAFLASPSALAAKWFKASTSISTRDEPSPRTSSVRARFSRAARSSSGTGSSGKTWERDSRGELIAK